MSGLTRPASDLFMAQFLFELDTMLLLGPVVFPLPSKAPEIIKQTSAPEKAALANPHTCSPAYLSSLC
ncbi:hypothetical protein J6590_094473 [Homalodisca vitripennis]|nr:hypothetical protein J6590_094473 [Homalodisca vitripennis]